jgi:hypothetical protein
MSPVDIEAMQLNPHIWLVNVLSTLFLNLFDIFMVCCSYLVLLVGFKQRVPQSRSKYFDIVTVLTNQRLAADATHVISKLLAAHTKREDS